MGRVWPALPRRRAVASAAATLLGAVYALAPLTLASANSAANQPGTSASGVFAGGDFVTAVSEPGDYIGAGAARVWRAEAGSTLDIAGIASDIASVEVSNSAADHFVLTFAAPPGQALVPGTYTNAQRTPFRSAGHPGIDIYGDHRGCSTTTGSFTVFDIVPDLSRLHLVYEQYCEGSPRALFGEIRYGLPAAPNPLIAPDRITWPVAYPTMPRRTVPVTVVNTGAASLTVTGAAITSGSVDFSVAGDSCGVLAPGSSCVVEIRFSPSAAGMRAGTLTVSDSTGATQNVPLTGIGSPGVSSWAMHSEPGDWVGAGRDWAFNSSTSTILARGTAGQLEIFVDSPGADSFSDVRFNAVFDAGSSGRLQPGIRYRVAGHQGGDPAVPWMRVSGNGRDCNTAMGTFTVNQLEFAGGAVRKFGATFEQHCGDQTPALFGSIAYQADQVLPVPAAVPGEAMGTTSQGGAPVSTGPPPAGGVGTSVAVTGPYLTPVGIFSERTTFSGPRSGYAMYGNQVQIDATQRPDSFLTITFTLDQSFARPPVVFKDGVLVPACLNSSGAPDPSPSCTASVAEVDGDTVITVRTLGASVWNFAEPLGPNQAAQDVTVLVPDSDPGGGEFNISVTAPGSGGIDMTTPVTGTADGVFFLRYTAELTPVTVTDTRVGAQAWTVVGQMSNFDPALIFGRYLGWDPAIVTPGMGAVPGDVVPPGYPGTGAGLHTTRILASAPEGHEGEGVTETTAVVGAALTLHVPTAVPTGTYTGTLTLTALS